MTTEGHNTLQFEEMIPEAQQHMNGASTHKKSRPEESAKIECSRAIPYVTF